MHTSKAPKSLPTLNTTLPPLAIANIPSTFSLIKPTWITTLLSIPLLEVDPVLFAFLLKPLHGLLNQPHSGGFTLDLKCTWSALEFKWTWKALEVHSAVLVKNGVHTKVKVSSFGVNLSVYWENTTLHVFNQNVCEDKSSRTSAKHDFPFIDNSLLEQCQNKRIAMR